MPWLLMAAVGAVPLATAIVPVVAAQVKPTKTETRPAAKAARSATSPAGRSAVAYAGQNEPPAINGQGAERPRVDPLAVAARVDELILTELKKAGAEVAPRCSDEDFLRRVSFDIAGVSPSPQEVTLFGLDPDSHKRNAAIDRLLASSDYAENWARYWRDVVFSRATEMRALFARRPFETWLKSQFAENQTWDKVATALLTATGDVYEKGETAFIFAQQADPTEVAAETSRVFLGIQLQCANCHDHPNDSWKREQFHSLAAFFPRMRLDRKAQTMPPSFELVSLNVEAGGRGRGRGRDDIQQLRNNPELLIRRFDTNRDGKISREEAKSAPNGARFIEQLIALGDANKDGFLTTEEIRKLPPPPMPRGRGSAEYRMPDLQHPQSEGKKLDPVFFLGNLKAGAGLSDLDRRQSLARYITSTDNPWFARAFVNRIWAQLVGEGFYMPIDDIGPERTAKYPEALDALSAGFTASGYDVAWLFRTIASTETYQRQARARDPKAPAPAFASANPIRLRADQLYDALARVLGFKDEPLPQDGPMMGMGMGGRFSRRGQFETLFGFDPSTAPDELTATIPQALFMMNSAFMNSLIRAGGQTRLRQILDKYKNDDDALSELYLVVHAREPSAKEAQVCRDYIRDVNNRNEAFEDILWSLLNSTEFQSKR
jgi:hypothetical protein